MDTFNKVWNENKACECAKTKRYTCEICGKSYDSIKERSTCETKCIEEKAKAEAALKKKQIEEQKTKRKADIEAKTKELNELIKSYCKDYGSLHFGDNHIFDDEPMIGLTKLLGGWF